MDQRVAPRTKDLRSGPGTPKVLVFANRYPSDADPAVNPFIREQAKAVSSHAEVVVVCNDGFLPHRRRRYELSDTIHDGLRTLRVRYRRPWIRGAPHLAHRAGLARAVALLSSEGFVPDLVHAHFFPAGFYAVRLGRELGVPVVISEHATRLRPGGLPKSELRRARRALEGADLVCPDSHDLGRQIRALGIQARTRPVPNVVDTSLFAPAGRRPPGEDDRTRILFTALLHPRKGLDDLLHALREVRRHRADFVLDVVGDGPSRAELEGLATALELDDAVTFHGIQAKAGVARFMANADFFVLPSHEENLPCVVIEAMASGLPVVATDVGGVAEMIDERRGTLVPDGDRGALADAIDGMLDRHERYDRDHLVAYSAKRFSYDAVGRKFSEIYAELLDRRARAASTPRR